MAHPDIALAAVMEGANTSPDLAEELDWSVKYASAVLSQLHREGHIVWRGRYMPRVPGVRGPGTRVYEVAVR
jgi:hypothetical protein